MRKRHTDLGFFLCATLVSGCAVDGYDPQAPTKVTCGCGDGDACYQGGAQLASASGETAETGEQLLYFSQCACFEGSMAGCNTISHFAKDYVRACETGVDVKNSCTIAGFVYRHGVQVPNLNGRSFDADSKAASSAFAKACQAGATNACALAR
jgi:hypothetical protein